MQSFLQNSNKIKILQSLSNERICKIHHEKNPDHRSSFSITGHISIALGYALTTHPANQLIVSPQSRGSNLRIKPNPYGNLTYR